MANLFFAKRVYFECLLCGDTKPTQMTMIKHLKSKHKVIAHFLC